MIMKKYLPHTLILIGLVIIGIALYQKISTTYYQNKLVEEYDKYISRLNFDIEKEEGLINIEEESLPVDKEHDEGAEAEGQKENPIDKYLEGKEISGIIEIPKLSVVAAILEGTDDKALKYTVGHYPGTANPGEKGNYVLLGHRNYVYGHYFRRIDELNPGDEVIIKKGLETYTYLVTESFVVSPEEVWVLDTTEETMLTMITCTPMITYTDRLIVRGVISEQ
jgi:sortase A